MPVAIKAEKLSKAYQLGEFSTGALTQDIKRWWIKRSGGEDPFLKIGETNDRTTKGTSNIVWSLKDINFEISQGEAVGIIGRNGAGKSTLLKILSRVTIPTLGSVKVKGKIASLLEVGTGFHPELTGRENIFLNGAILGMRKKEIRKKFDEIVDFSGVERYIDTPVKRYSSGMYVRLAFAVAAHLESEILIIDEVLAVGDAEFQKKCLGKMDDVSKQQGRTILFVSHNIAAIRNLCTKGIMLQNGAVSAIGDITSVINCYHESQDVLAQDALLLSKCKRFNLQLPYFINENGEQKSQFDSDEKIFLRFKFHFFEKVKKINVGIALYNSDDIRIFTSHSADDKSYNIENLENEIVIDTDFNFPFLAPGKYKVIFGVRDEYEQNVIYNPDTYLYFKILDNAHNKNTKDGLLWHTTKWYKAL